MSEISYTVREDVSKDPFKGVSQFSIEKNKQVKDVVMMLGGGYAPLSCLALGVCIAYANPFKPESHDRKIINLINSVVPVDIDQVLDYVKRFRAVQNNIAKPKHSLPKPSDPVDIHDYFGWHDYFSHEDSNQLREHYSQISILYRVIYSLSHG